MRQFWIGLLFCIMAFSGYADQARVRLERFSNLHGAPGYEDPVRQQFIDYIKAYNVPYKVDGLGNVLVRMNPGKQKKKVLIMAHLDEVGFMVSKIDKEGYIRVMPIGGWLPEVLWAHSWVLNTGKKEIHAVSGFDAPHVTVPLTHEHKSVTTKDFFLDTGYSAQQLKKMGVRPGTPVTPNTKFEEYGRYYTGKAFDDRAGVAMMVDLIGRIAADKTLAGNLEVQFAATVQEEVGLRGAKAIYDSLKPDVVLNLEAGIAHDYPMQLTERGDPILGKGPTFFVYDRTMIPSQSLINELSAVADKAKIPYQWESEVSYGQDAAMLQSSGHGVATVNIGIPIRYAHSHIGMMDRRDYDNGVKLVLAYLNQK